MGIKFELKRDRRTPECKHEQGEGCYHCCSYCNYDVHRCGGCGEPLTHDQCGGSSMGTCDDCYKQYFTDENSDDTHKDKT